MLNKVWPIFLIISIIYAFFSGNLEEINKGIFESAESAVSLCISFFATICVWNGIMQVAFKSKFVNYMIKLLNPLINFLFSELKTKKEIKKKISMNIIANILGLGNAATPLGIKAMEDMQEINKDKNKLSDSMMMFIVINTASLQIIPTTIISIRMSLNSKQPTSIVFPVWCASICSVMTAIIFTKIIIKIKK